MKLAAVIVFYHPDEENVNYYKTYEKELDKIYVVDNSDDSLIRIKDTDKVNYIKLNENKGIATALNIGAENAIKDGFKWLLTLDQDSKISSKNISDMKKFIEKHKDEKDIGLVSPYQDIGKNDELPKDEYEDIIEIMTSGNIINLDAYKKIGGFKDWLFIDCVDTEYCMNLHKNEYRVLRLNRVVMKHQLGNLIIHNFLGKHYDTYNHNYIRRYYIVRNNFYIWSMYGDAYPEYCEHLKRVQKGQVKRIIMFEKDKIRKLKMMYKGYKDYKNGIKGKLEVK